MRSHKATIGIAILGALTSACGTAVTPVQPSPLRGPVSAFTGAPQVELLVTLKPGHGVEELRQLGTKLGFSVSRYWPQIQSAAIRLERFGSTRNVLTALQQAEGVAAVQTSGPVVPEALPSR